MTFLVPACVLFPPQAPRPWPLASQLLLVRPDQGCLGDAKRCLRMLCGPGCHRPGDALQISRVTSHRIVLYKTMVRQLPFLEWNCACSAFVRSRACATDIYFYIFIYIYRHEKGEEGWGSIVDL
jgi:hypothetical protein